MNSEHIRCRGIPTSCIQYKASQDKTTALDIHKSLYKGEAIEFDLINDLTKVVSKDNRDHTVSNVTKLSRKTKYVRNGSDKICIT